MRPRGRMQVGISGWQYPAWRGRFYPAGLPHRRELEFASRAFGTIEINGTFYSLKKPESFARWYDETPDGFTFAVKGSRFITHMKKLKDARVPLANFFASGVLRLRDKLGPFLWQLPPQLGFDADRMRAFMDLLPRDTREAARLARDHDGKLKGRTWLEIDAVRPLRHAFEVRHESFVDAGFFSLLSDRGHAFVVSDSAGRFPLLAALTADFIYVRLHGSTELYVSGYADEEIERWAGRIRRWRIARGKSEGTASVSRDVYVYFDNDAKGHAPFDALRLASRLSGRQEFFEPRI